MQEAAVRLWRRLALALAPGEKLQALKREVTGMKVNVGWRNSVMFAISVYLQFIQSPTVQANGGESPRLAAIMLLRQIKEDVDGRD